MARELIWSDEALGDVDGIASYIARDSVHYAKRIVAELFELSDRIAEDPQSGRIVPELNEQALRERFLYSYRVIYEVQVDRVAILAVLHGKRLLASVGERF